MPRISAFYGIVIAVYCEEHGWPREELEANWERARNEQPLEAIEPSPSMIPTSAPLCGRMVPTSRLRRSMAGSLDRARLGIGSHPLPLGCQRQVHCTAVVCRVG